ncbi:unnamed protein product [Adineta steineri]|uniref:Uncharacterized protein n=1 Tax=Adineta steineri TaxID=433720 RepID=A0A815PK36_9BILA|nr:unnamed protein product [Adineta steineri]CAF1449941.1 unnamed protein product [Adineta steineri]
MANIERFVDLIDTFQTESVQTFAQIANIRNTIKNIMHSAKVEVRNIQKIQEEIVAPTIKVKGYEKDQNKYKYYTTLNQVPHDIKAKYDAATNNTNKANQDLITVNGKKRILEATLIQKLDDIKRQCTELKKICGGFNLVNEINDTIHQLEIPRNSIRDFDVRRQADEFINNLKAFCNALEATGSQQRVQQKRQLQIVDTYSSYPVAAAQNTNPPTPGDPSSLSDEHHSTQRKNSGRPHRPRSSAMNGDNYIKKIFVSGFTPGKKRQKKTI